MAARDLAGDPSEPSRRRRIGEEDVTWSHVSGGVYGRDDSLKENTNPKCVIPKNLPAAGHSNGNGNGNGNGASQRFSRNLKPTAAPIIGISGKLGEGCARRQHHHPPAMFPKNAKTGGGGRNPKPAVPEPGSPKVSCIGKVLPGRERDRRLPRSQEMRGGCCPGFGFLIRRSRSRKSAAVECVDWSPPPRLPLSAVARASEAKEAATAPAPVLGGMRRFVSGRRAADWAAERVVDGRVARSGPL